MTNPCIICVAITGSVPRKENNPALPITVDEQVESTHAAFEAGASIVHCHVRNDDQSTTSDPEKFALLKEGLEKHCPGIIVQLSTGGRSGSGQARGGMLPLRPDMASLAVGSNNFPTRVYENSPDLVDWLAAEMLKHEVKPEIEAFDLSHIFQAVKMQADGRLKGPLHIQFVMGVKNAMPVDRDVFDFYVETVRRIAPDATWCGAGIAGGPGPAQRVVDRRRRPYPHGARGQRPARPRPARAVERRARPARRRALREVRAPGRDRRRGAARSCICARPCNRPT